MVVRVLSPEKKDKLPDECPAIAVCVKAGLGNCFVVFLSAQISPATPSQRKYFLNPLKIPPNVYKVSNFAF